jgi:hypothetical protein
MTQFNWQAFDDKEFVALIRNGGIVAGYDNDFSRAMVEEAARRIEERDEARLALDGLRSHHAKIIMALYKIDHDVFGPLTSIEGIAELKRQRDELARQLEREQEIRDTVVKTAAELARANEKLAAELLALKVKAQS